MRNDDDGGHHRVLDQGEPVLHVGLDVATRGGRHPCTRKTLVMRVAGKSPLGLASHLAWAAR